MSQVDYNRLSVRLELQADFYAGVWAHHAQSMRAVLEPGDLEEAMNAAHQIGDDTLQKQGQGRVVPDSFTHGSAAQRMAWFKRGFETGDMRKGDTFDDADLQRRRPPLAAPRISRSCRKCQNRRHIRHRVANVAAGV